MENKSFFGTAAYKETGTDHIDRGRGCEDFVYTARAADTGVAVAALCDGAGSYANAAFGAETACAAAGAFIADRFGQLYGMGSAEAAALILREVRAPLEAEARRTGNDLISYSATLLCAAMHPDGRYIVFHVGDGAVVGYSPKKGCRPVSLYTHTGPANQTTFVTVDPTDYDLIRGRDTYAAFALMSDGPEEYLVNEIEVSPRVRMMLQLAYFVPEENMEAQMASLTAMLKHNGMADDASFALLYDTRRAADVFASLTPEMKGMLFELEDGIGPRRLKTALAVLEALASAPEGLTLRQLTRMLHVHSPAIAKKKLASLLDMQLIELRGGKYCIAK